MSASKQNIRGVLFDLDGVLYVDQQVIQGAIEVVSQLRSEGIQCRFVTNTSTLSVQAIQRKLLQLGFEVTLKEVFSAPQAAVSYLASLPNPVTWLLLAEDAKKDFSAFVENADKANVIVVGDIGDAWTYDILNRIFNRLMNGATLIAIHKNRFWQTAKGLQMDIGAFISGLEYASGQQAQIVGKPSPDFFHAAVNSMQLGVSEVLMIGDDIDSDVAGAQAVGIAGVLVKTGKYRETYTVESPVNPDAILNSVAQLPRWLGLS